jgi:hypothetical protein
MILESMQPLAVDLRLFTDIGGEPLRLNAGRGLMARVMAADGSGRGAINIAGVVLEAQLPRHVRAGEQIRLVVRHLDEQRVVLELAHPGSGAAAATTDLPPAPMTVRLPDGGELRVGDEDAQPGREQASGRDAQTVALRYDAPTLGALDLRFELHRDALRVSVTAAPGPALDLALAHAPALRDALTQAGDRPASVTVLPRRQPLDVYA